MTKHINNNSHNIQLRELQYEDELQGYDVQNAKRSKKKQVKKMKRDAYEWQFTNWYGFVSVYYEAPERVLFYC